MSGTVYMLEYIFEKQIHAYRGLTQYRCEQFDEHQEKGDSETRANIGGGQ